MDDFDDTQLGLDITTRSPSQHKIRPMALDFGSPTQDTASLSPTTQRAVDAVHLSNPLSMDSVSDALPSFASSTSAMVSRPSASASSRATKDPELQALLAKANELDTTLEAFTSTSGAPRGSRRVLGEYTEDDLLELDVSQLISHSNRSSAASVVKVSPHRGSDRSTQSFPTSFTRNSSGLPPLPSASISSSYSSVSMSSLPSTSVPTSSPSAVGLHDAVSAVHATVNAPLPQSSSSITSSTSTSTSTLPSTSFFARVPAPAPLRVSTGSLGAAGDDTPMYSTSEAYTPFMSSYTSTFNSTSASASTSVGASAGVGIGMGSTRMYTSSHPNTTVSSHIPLSAFPNTATAAAAYAITPLAKPTQTQPEKQVSGAYAGMTGSNVVTTGLSRMSMGDNRKNNDSVAYDEADSVFLNAFGAPTPTVGGMPAVTPIATSTPFTNTSAMGKGTNHPASRSATTAPMKTTTITATTTTTNTNGTAPSTDARRNLSRPRAPSASANINASNSKNAKTTITANATTTRAGTTSATAARTRTDAGTRAGTATGIGTSVSTGNGASVGKGPSVGVAAGVGAGLDMRRQAGTGLGTATGSSRGGTGIATGMGASTGARVTAGVATGMATGSATGMATGRTSAFAAAFGVLPTVDTSASASTAVSTSTPTPASAPVVTPEALLQHIETLGGDSSLPLPLNPAARVRRSSIGLNTSGRGGAKGGDAGAGADAAMDSTAQTTQSAVSLLSPHAKRIADAIDHQHGLRAHTGAHATTINTTHPSNSRIATSTSWFTATASYPSRADVSESNGEGLEQVLLSEADHELLLGEMHTEQRALHAEQDRQQSRITPRGGYGTYTSTSAIRAAVSTTNAAPTATNPSARGPDHALSELERQVALLESADNTTQEPSRAAQAAEEEMADVDAQLERLLGAPVRKDANADDALLCMDLAQVFTRKNATTAATPNNGSDARMHDGGDAYGGPNAAHNQGSGNGDSAGVGYDPNIYHNNSTASTTAQVDGTIPSSLLTNPSSRVFAPSGATPRAFGAVGVPASSGAFASAFLKPRYGLGMMGGHGVGTGMGIGNVGMGTCGSVGAALRPVGIPLASLSSLASSTLTTTAGATAGKTGLESPQGKRKRADGATDSTSQGFPRVTTRSHTATSGNGSRGGSGDVNGNTRANVGTPSRVPPRRFTPRTTTTQRPTAATQGRNAVEKDVSKPVAAPRRQFVPSAVPGTLSRSMPARPPRATTTGTSMSGNNNDKGHNSTTAPNTTARIATARASSRNKPSVTAAITKADEKAKADAEKDSSVARKPTTRGTVRPLSTRTLPRVATRSAAPASASTSTSASVSANGSSLVSSQGPVTRGLLRTRHATTADASTDSGSADKAAAVDAEGKVVKRARVFAASRRGNAAVPAAKSSRSTPAIGRQGETPAVRPTATKTGLAKPLSARLRPQVLLSPKRKATAVSGPANKRARVRGSPSVGVATDRIRRRTSPVLVRLTIKPLSGEDVCVRIAVLPLSRIRKARAIPTTTGARVVTRAAARAAARARVALPMHTPARMAPIATPLRAHKRTRVASQSATVRGPRAMVDPQQGASVSAVATRSSSVAARRAAGTHAFGRGTDAAMRAGNTAGIDAGKSDEAAAPPRRPLLRPRVPRVAAITPRRPTRGNDEGIDEGTNGAGIGPATPRVPRIPHNSSLFRRMPTVADNTVITTGSTPSLRRTPARVRAGVLPHGLPMSTPVTARLTSALHGLHIRSPDGPGMLYPTPLRSAAARHRVPGSVSGKRDFPKRGALTPVNMSMSMSVPEIRMTRAAIARANAVYNRDYGTDMSDNLETSTYKNSQHPISGQGDRYEHIYDPTMDSSEVSATPPFSELHFYRPDECEVECPDSQIPQRPASVAVKLAAVLHEDITRAGTQLPTRMMVSDEVNGAQQPSYPTATNPTAPCVTPSADAPVVMSNVTTGTCDATGAAIRASVDIEGNNESTSGYEAEIEVAVDDAAEVLTTALVMDMHDIVEIEE